MTDEYLTRDGGSLAANARAYRYHADLDRLADLRENDLDEFLRRTPGSVLSQVEIYADMRDHHRRAVAAGVIPDDRGPNAA